MSLFDGSSRAGISCDHLLREVVIPEPAHARVIIRRLRGNHRPLSACVWRDRLIVGCADGYVRVWDENTEVACSGGSACSSGATQGSHVLRALGCQDPQRASVRFSFSRYTTSADIDKALEAVDKVFAPVLVEG